MYFQSIGNLRNYFLCLSWQTCCNIHFCKQNYPKNYTHSPINCIVMEGSLPSGLRSPDDIIGSSLDNDTLAPHKVKKGSTLLFRKMLTMPSSQAFELNLIWSKWSHRSRSLLTFTSQIHLKLNFKHNIQQEIYVLPDGFRWIYITHCFVIRIVNFPICDWINNRRSTQWSVNKLIRSFEKRITIFEVA